MMPLLPIQQHLPDIQKALGTVRCAVIQAPPGTGKTTRVPLALLDEPWLENKKILILEPRRLAAISCASHMASLLKEPVGQTVGYQIRLDRKIGPDTRVEVVTEGIFTRRIQHDPALADVGLVIFDEFHERNIHSDLGLALCLDTFEALREDLRLLVMSATLDMDEMSRFLKTAARIVSDGKSFPVRTVYLPPPLRPGRSTAIESVCESAVVHALTETQGDILVFLPGVREIKKLSALLTNRLDSTVQVIPLYGDLTGRQQAKAFDPPGPGERKIVIATAIAETSITIDGIRVVIDSGLMRVPRFCARTGMSRLETLPVSKASADQRRGRAGRTGPGTCYRLWTAYDHGLLKPFTRPEILSVDLTGLVLELAVWGVTDPGQLKWLDLPDSVAFEQAKNLLQVLGGLDNQGKITAHGKKMADLGLHPRFAHMVIKGHEMGHGFLAVRIAALLNERDIIQFDSAGFNPDVRLRLELIRGMEGKHASPDKSIRINKAIVHRIFESEKKLARDVGIPLQTLDIEMTGRLLAQAYPDRIARKRDNSRNAFLMASGKGAFFSETHPISLTEYIVAVHLDGNPTDARIFLAASYSKSFLEADFAGSLNSRMRMDWDPKTLSVTARQETFFASLLISQQPVSTMDPEQAAEILIQEIRKKGVALLPWTRQMESLRERCEFLKQSGRFPTLPDVSDQTLENEMDLWLKPFLSGIYSFKALERLDLDPAFSMILPWKDRKVVESNAPTHVVVPSGSKKPVRYRDRHGILASPVLEVRLQEMFGLLSTPRIAGQSLPLTLHLLSPAGRPVQITKDLASFWQNTYPEVKKDLMGRYPKHFWPDDPLTAIPTSRAKRKSP